MVHIPFKEREKQNLSKLLLVSDHTNPEIEVEIKKRRQHLLLVREGLKKIDYLIQESKFAFKLSR